MGREKRIEDQIKYSVRIEGGVAIKIHGNAYTGAGIPDIFGGVHGTPFAIEVKSDKSYKIEPLQIFFLKKLGSMGYTVGVVNSLDAFWALLRGEDNDGILWRIDND